MHVMKQRGGEVKCDTDPAVFPLSSFFDRSTECVRRELHAITDAEDGNRAVKNLRVQGWCIRIQNRRRSAGKDDSCRMLVKNGLNGRAKRQYFAVDMFLANPPGDQLGILCTEVDDDDFLKVIQYNTSQGRLL